MLLFLYFKCSQSQICVSHQYSNYLATLIHSNISNHFLVWHFIGYLLILVTWLYRLACLIYTFACLQVISIWFTRRTAIASIVCIWLTRWTIIVCILLTRWTSILTLVTLDAGRTATLASDGVTPSTVLACTYTVTLAAVRALSVRYGGNRHQVLFHFFYIFMYVRTHMLMSIHSQL